MTWRGLCGIGLGLRLGTSLSARATILGQFPITVSITEAFGSIVEGAIIFPLGGKTRRYISGKTSQ